MCLVRKDIRLYIAQIGFELKDQGLVEKEIDPANPLLRDKKLMFYLMNLNELKIFLKILMYNYDLYYRKLCY